MTGEAFSVSNEGRLCVVMIAEYPFSEAEQGRGGVMQSNFHLVEGFEILDDPGIDLHVLSQTFGCTRYETRKSGPVTLHFVPKQQSEVAKFLLNPLRLLLVLLKLQRKLRPHVVHGQGSVIAILLSQRLARRNVQTVHGIYRNEESKVGASLGRRIRVGINRVVEANYLGKIRNLIALTVEIEKIVREATTGAARIFPSHVAIDPAFFREVPDHPRERFTILFVAAITPRKGLHFLLDAFEQIASQFPAADMRIVGMWDWAPDYVAELQARHAALIAAGRLTFTGSVDREGLFREYAIADMLALSSLAESAPAVVSQAMCLGLPVVATSVGGVPQMVEDGVTGLLVPPGETGALHAAMTRLLSDAALRRRLGMAARAVAVQSYHPRSVAQVTAEIYRAVAADKP